MAKVPPQRPVYDFENTASQTGRSKDKKRPVYDYNRTVLHKSDAPRTLETSLPLEPQHTRAAAQPKEAAQQPAYDQNGAAERRKPSGTTGMRQMILPLGTVQTPPRPDAQAQPKSSTKAPSNTPQAQRKKPQTKRKRPSQKGTQRQAAQKGAMQKNAAQRRPAGKTSGERPQKTARQTAQKAPNKPLTYGEARRRRRNRNMMAASAVVLVVFLGAMLSFTVLFKIETIAVTGETRYTAQEILTASSMQKGDNLLRLRPQTVAQELCAKLPYLQSVTVKKKLPATVEIIAEPATETYTLNTASGWAVLGADFKVLRLDAEPTAGLTILFGTSAETPTPGAQLVFTEPEKQEALVKVTKAITGQELTQVTEIDVTNTLEISFLYAGRIRVLLGTVNDLDNKVDYAKYIITPEGSESLPDTARGTLDVSSRTEEGRLQGFWRAGNL